MSSLSVNHGVRSVRCVHQLHTAPNRSNSLSKFNPSVGRSLDRNMNHKMNSLSWWALQKPFYRRPMHFNVRRAKGWPCVWREYSPNMPSAKIIWIFLNFSILSGNLSFCWRFSRTFEYSKRWIKILFYSRGSSSFWSYLFGSNRSAFGQERKVFGIQTKR